VDEALREGRGRDGPRAAAEEYGGIVREQLGRAVAAGAASSRR
jgi:hypothetical protein